MSVGRTFEESLLKAVRSLECGTPHLRLAKYDSASLETLWDRVLQGSGDRIYAVAELLRRQVSAGQIAEKTAIDRFFLDKIANIMEEERILQKNRGSVRVLREAKRMGFSDAAIASFWQMPEEQVFELRRQERIFPVYKMIDTCASEFESYVPYFYSTYEGENESVISDKPSVIVLGAGPIRIGQGVEFDYSTVHAVRTIKEEGYEAIVINNNPETVSTDYTTSDKLYFEPLCPEDVMNIIELEKPMGVIVTLGGQTAVNLAEPLHQRGVRLIGTDCEAIDRAEDRDLFEKLLHELGIPEPRGMAVTCVEDGVEAARTIGYPVLVRPSFVLGGRAMQIVSGEKEMRRYLQTAVEIDVDRPVLVDRYISGKELEVDAVCDGEQVFIPGIMELVVRGLFNIQFIVDRDDEVYIIEVNPRSSRTVPFLSKATGWPLPDMAARVSLGISLKDQGIENLCPEPGQMWFVKVPVFSFSKLSGMDSYLSPEMKSTGEAIGYDFKLHRAMYKALTASGIRVQNYGTVIFTLADEDKAEALPLARRFYDMGFNIEATTMTAEYMREHGVRAKLRRKLSEGSTEILDSIRAGYVSYVVNTRAILSGVHYEDGAAIRKCASEHRVTMFTSLDTVRVLLDVLEEMTIGVMPI